MQRTDVVGERYMLRDSLGRGGMGEVYLARDELLGREVAVKLLRAQHAENAQFVERFRREARNAAALSHQNIVSVYDAGESPGGTPYMAMEYVGGGTLAGRIEKEGPLDALEAAGIALQVACALQEAHGKGLIHRDIKPHNIFLVERSEASASSSATDAGAGGVAPGSVKVGDFGIARAAAETAMTETSLIVGTVRYLSPEQAMGTEVGPQSDLYSLGIVLYEMLTGRVPFDAENPIAIAMKHVSEAPTPPRGINPGVPEGIQTITHRLLSKDPEDRYAEAATLIADLERVGRGLPPERLPSEGLPPTNPGAQDAENETDFLQGQPDARPFGPVQGRGLPSHHPVRRTRRRRRIGLLMVFALLAGGLALVGGEDRVAALSSVYDGFSPEGGAQRVGGMRSVDMSSAVEIPVSRVEVPDVVGDTEAAAEKILDEAGFGVEKRSRENPDRQEGTVLSQNPDPKKRVQRGATVTITVAEAPATVAVPGLTGLDVQEAEGRLFEAGLALGEQGEAYSDSTSAGLILGQDSAAGAELERGASVGVTVSLGPEPAAATTAIADQEPASGPEPAPEPEPSLAPGSEPAPEPEPSSVPEVEPPVQPTPEVEPEPDPAQQEPAQAPVQEPAQEPVQQEPATQPAPEPQPEPSAQPEPAPEPEPITEPAPVPGVPTPEQAPSEPGNPPSGEPAGADSVVPATPEPVVPTMPDVFDN